MDQAPSQLGAHHIFAPIPLSHPTTLLLLPGSTLEAGPLDLTAQLLPSLYAHLPHSLARDWSIVSAADLSPVHFRGPQARQVSCYAIFEGWLLLSLPPCCLSSRTPFCLTLSPHLGALTIVWVNPLSVMRLTPHKPASPLLLRQHIWSSKRRWTLSNPCLLIGALQRWLHPRRQDWDPLRWELAITELDRLLAPCPQSGD